MAISKIPSAGTTGFGRRNLIINGGMQVAQRGTSVTAQTGGGIKTVDRFYTEVSGCTYDHAQVSDGPDGFPNSIKVTVDGAFTPTAGQYFIPFEQRIEGQNLSHLAYGTSSAKTVTLSFWIKSNKTGTYVVDFSNNHAPSIRRWSQSYTIDAANTWERKTLTWTGDTASGTEFEDDNTSGATFFWWMTAGTTFTSGALSGAWETSTSANRAVGVPSSLADNDEFYITGVQLEVGSTATEFEHRSYGEELQLCQRYYYELNSTDDLRYIGGLAGRSTTSAYGMGQLHMTPMRAAPSVSILGLAVNRGDVARTVTTPSAGTGRYGWVVSPTFNADSGCTDGSALMLYLNATPSYIKFDAEL